MKASAVFVHHEHPRAALQLGTNEFFAIQMSAWLDLKLFDEVSGDLVSGKVSSLVNVTTSRLIRVEVLGRYSTLAFATWGAMLSRSL